MRLFAAAGFGCFHEGQRPRRVCGVEEVDHDGFELLELDRFRDVRVEASVGALGVDVTEDISRERDYRKRLVSLLPLPGADFTTCLIAVFIGHVEVTL